MGLFSSVKSRNWIKQECISIVKKKNQIQGALTKDYKEQKAVNGLGGTSQYDALNISSEEKEEMEKVSQTAKKVWQDIATVRKSRNFDFHATQDSFSQEWKKMENIMRQKGVEAIEIPYKD